MMKNGKDKYCVSFWLQLAHGLSAEVNFFV